MNSHIGEKFQILSGVPQGSVLSPTFFTIYTKDIPQPDHNCKNIIYAHDITQIISYPGKSRHMMAALTKR